MLPCFSPGDGSEVCAVTCIAFIAFRQATCACGHRAAVTVIGLWWQSGRGAAVTEWSWGCGDGVVVGLRLRSGRGAVLWPGPPSSSAAVEGQGSRGRQCGFCISSASLDSTQCKFSSFKPDLVGLRFKCLNFS